MYSEIRHFLLYMITLFLFSKKKTPTSSKSVYIYRSIIEAPLDTDEMS